MPKLLFDAADAEAAADAQNAEAVVDAADAEAAAAVNAAQTKTKKNIYRRIRGLRMPWTRKRTPE